MKRHIQQSAMGSELDRRQPGNRLILKLAVMNESQPTRAFSDKNVAAREKGHAPRTVQPLRDRDNTNLLSIGGEFLSLAHVLSRTGNRNQNECCDNEERVNASSDVHLHGQQ